MENKEKNPKVVVIDRREDNGVLLTRRIAERYGTEKYLSLPGTYRKIGEEAFKGNGKIERLGLPDSVLELGRACISALQCTEGGASAGASGADRRGLLCGLSQASAGGDPCLCGDTAGGDISGGPEASGGAVCDWKPTCRYRGRCICGVYGTEADLSAGQRDQDW